MTSLIPEDTLLTASDEQLSVTIWQLKEEQSRRAMAEGDPATVGEDGFVSGFDRAGKPRLPYLVGGLLVCPGGKMEKSKSSHECIFVATEEGWVWDYPDGLFDDMRQIPGRKWRQAVTVIPATDGLTFDVVTSKQTSGNPGCRMTNVRSFVVRNGSLVETQVRDRPLSAHR